jgi:hypothetical protein
MWSRNFRDRVEDYAESEEEHEGRDDQQQRGEGEGEEVVLSRDERDMLQLDLSQREESGIVVKENPWYVPSRS